VFVLKAVVFLAPDKVELCEVEDPRIGANDVLIETRVAGISAGTETGILRGVFPRIVRGEIKYPIIPGYADGVGGIVKEVGEKVNDFQVGDRVIAGRTTYPIKGYSVYWGGHVEYRQSLASEVRKLPDDISFEEAAFHNHGTDAIHCARRANLHFGETVAIIGMGSMGQQACQIAKIGGAGQVIAVDIFDTKLELSKKSGADHIINSKKENLADRVMELTDGQGADVVIEAVGAPGLVNQSFDILKTHGRVLVWGRHVKPEEVDFTDKFFYKEISIIGTFDRLGEDADELLELWFNLVKTKRLKLKHLITHDIPTENVAEAYRIMSEETDKYCFILLRWK